MVVHPASPRQCEYFRNGLVHRKTTPLFCNLCNASTMSPQRVEPHTHTHTRPVAIALLLLNNECDDDDDGGYFS